MVYSFCDYKNLGLILELCFSHVTMPVKFELHLLFFTVINHPYDIMPRIVIFVLDAIVHI